jgi:hypothetical protein
MRAATFLTTTAMSCFVLVLGCRDRTADGPVLRPTAHERTTTIRAPTLAPQSAEPLPSHAPTHEDSEPVMSTPPVEEEPEAPALGPEPAPVAPRAPPSRYEDRCGRPLVA